MNHPELLSASELLNSWNHALQVKKETLTLDLLPAQVQLYQKWSGELNSKLLLTTEFDAANKLLNTTIRQLTEIWRLALDRVINLEFELKNPGQKLRVKSFKVVHDSLLHQLMLVILTLNERLELQHQQSKLYDMLAGHFVRLILALHTSRKVDNEPLHEMLLLLEKEYETFPALLDFKLLQPSIEHAAVINYVPLPLLNLIFTQGLHSARFIIRTGQPKGMKSSDWATLLAAALLQDIGLTMGWGLGTPRQHILKGEQAEQQLSEHAGLGAALLQGIKNYPGLHRLVSEHHLPFTAKQFKHRTRLTTLEQQSSLLRMAIMPVHLLYRPIEPGMHLDFLPGLVAQQQMQRLLTSEEILAPEIVTPLLKILHNSEDQLLLGHLGKLLPNLSNEKLPEYSRIDQAHAIVKQHDVIENNHTNFHFSNDKHQSLAG
jgi:hypothetical protein